MFLRIFHAVPSAALVAASMLVAVCASAPASAALEFRPSEFRETAFVDSIPPFGGNAAVDRDGSAPGTLTFQPVFGGSLGLDATAATFGGQRPRATATAVTSGAGPILVNLAAESKIKYYFGVEGPEGTSVPILASMNGVVEASGVCCNDASSALSRVDISGPNPFGSTITFKQVTASRVNGPPADAFDLTTAFFILPNRIYTVELRALAIVRAEGGGATARAEADPLIVIDPSFAGIDQYSLQFSSFAVPEPVPLPATAPLLLGALGIVAGLARRRRCPPCRSPDEAAA